jgi:hypothetical protein
MRMSKNIFVQFRAKETQAQRCLAIHSTMANWGSECNAGWSDSCPTVGRTVSKLLLCYVLYDQTCLGQIHREFRNSIWGNTASRKNLFCFPGIKDILRKSGVSWCEGCLNRLRFHLGQGCWAASDSSDFKAQALEGPEILVSPILSPWCW